MKWKWLILILCCFNHYLTAQLLDRVPGQLLIQLEADAQDFDLSDNIADFNHTPTELRKETLLSAHSNIQLYTFNEDAINADFFLKHIRAQPQVVQAQYNHWTTNRVVPDDLFYSFQWYLNNENYNEDTGMLGADIDVEAAWDITTGGVTAAGDTIVLAIIDDGIDEMHPDIATNLWKNNQEIPNNGIDDDGNGYVDDYRGWNVYAQSDHLGIGDHGTGIASVMGAIGNNGIGLAGLNWDVKLMTIVAGGGTEANVIAGYEYALQQRLLYDNTNGEKGAYVVVTNTSFGINYGQPEDSPLWCEFFDTLGEAGILSVAATANIDVNVDVVGDMPTTCSSPYLIAVTATDQQDHRINAAYGIENIDIAAPGKHIMTLMEEDGVGYRTGTSFAVPIVAGLVGLAYAVPCDNLVLISDSDPAYITTLMRNFVLSGAENIEALSGEVAGNRRVNAFHTLQATQGLCANCAPSIISVISSFYESLQFDFISFENDSTDLYIRTNQTDNWAVYTNITSPFTLNGLGECTEYSFYFTSHCGIDEINSPTYQVSTSGCCTTPQNFSWNLQTEASVLVDWEISSESEGYVGQYFDVFDQAWYDLPDVSMPPYFVNLFLECEEQQLRFATICDGTAGDWSEPITVFSGGCGPCIDLEYCPSQGLLSQSEYIKGFILNGDLTISEQNNGYGDLTDNEEIIILPENAEVEMVLLPGFTFLPYEENWRIWIDYNTNGVFEENEMCFETITPTSEPVVANFTLPNMPTNTLTRMRISMKYLNGDTPQEPCETFTYGEVEDYCIYVSNLLNSTLGCEAPTTFEMVEQNETSALLSWNAITTASSYLVEYYRIDYALLGNVETDEPQILLEDLSLCDTFHVKISPRCAGSLGQESQGFTFSTSCQTSNINKTYFQDSWTVSPNPFRHQFTINNEVNTSEKVSITLINVKGKEVIHKELTASDDWAFKGLEALPNGIYILKIQSETQLQTTKLLKLQ